MARPLSASALALMMGGLALAWGCAGRGLQPREAEGVAEPGALPTPTPLPTATPAPQFPQNQPLDESRPLKVRSARLRFDQRSQLTVFYGGVTVTHDTSTLLARELRSSDQGNNAEASGDVFLSDTRRQFTAEAGRVRYGNALQEGQLEDGVRLISQDPYGRPVTVTGRSGGYQGLSGTAWVDGGVQALRGDLTVTAGRAEMEEAGALLRLLRDVDLRLGSNQAVADRVDLWRDGQSLALSGNVRARFTPAELRQAAEQPWNNTSKEAE